MIAELAKFNSYLQERQRIAALNPELASSRVFYEMWESSSQPLPFRTEGADLSVGGKKLALAEGFDERGCFEWDGGRELPVLVMEGRLGEQRYDLIVSGSSFRVAKVLKPTYLVEREVTFGEKLEVIYDLILRIREVDPGKNVRLLSLKEYRAYLAEMAEGLDDSTREAMGRLNKDALAELLEVAVGDMAIDELSNQLALGLDGHFASASLDADVPSSSATAKPGRGQAGPVGRRTPWRMGQDLIFLSAATSIAAQLEEAYTVSLRDAELLSRNESGELVLKLVVDAESPLREGARLSVHLEGESGILGSLFVDLFEGTRVFARLAWKERDEWDLLRSSLYAKPQRSPSFFVSKLLEMTRERFSREQELDTEALAAVLGRVDCPPLSEEASGAPSGLDGFQAKAWASSVDQRNPVVLVQGPPGTGKTTVLESVLRRFCEQGKRVLVTAPSNTAVDNICRRLRDLPVLRFGRYKESIASDVAEFAWAESPLCINRCHEKKRAFGGAQIFAGTHVGVLRDEMILAEKERDGLFDVIVFDEAGMARMDEFLLCLQMARRVVLFGDHQQLPPFPLPAAVLEELGRRYAAIPRDLEAIAKKSAIEWLVDDRGFPSIRLQRTYRCQNPRLMRFASTLFYDAEVKPSSSAEYYQLSYDQRIAKYPRSTLALYDTSGLPEELRSERFVIEGRRPGLENPLEARVCERLFYDLLLRYPLTEISIIAPYRRQVRLLRQALSRERALKLVEAPEALTEEAWENFLHTRVATVDSFQGGESDVVMVTYVRSNRGGGIGFIDDFNRVNVAHTRCRREMIVVADGLCLAEQGRTNIFRRMIRAFARDGVVQRLTEDSEWVAGE